MCSSSALDWTGVSSSRVGANEFSTKDADVDPAIHATEPTGVDIPLNPNQIEKARKSLPETNWEPTTIDALILDKGTKIYQHVVLSHISVETNRRVQHLDTLLNLHSKSIYQKLFTMIRCKMIKSNTIHTVLWFRFANEVNIAKIRRYQSRNQ